MRIGYPLADKFTGMSFLDKKLKFPDKNEIMPICLPTSTSFKDTNREAFSVGYGIHTQNTPNKHLECITDGNGPDVFQECARRAFTQKGFKRYSKH